MKAITFFSIAAACTLVSFTSAYASCAANIQTHTMVCNDPISYQPLTPAPNPVVLNDPIPVTNSNNALVQSSINQAIALTQTHAALSETPQVSGAAALAKLAPSAGGMSCRNTVEGLLTVCGYN